ERSAHRPRLLGGYQQERSCWTLRFAPLLFPVANRTEADADDLMASIREPSRVATGSGGDVQNAPGRCRQQIQNRTMRILEREALVHLRELGGMGVVRGDGGRG